MKPILAGVAGLITLFAVQACKTFPEGGTANAPYVIHFSFDKEVNATLAEKTRFVDALAKYTVPSATKISVGGEVVWPPKLSEMTSEQVISGEENMGNKGTAHTGPGGTQSAAATQHTENPAFIMHTKVTQNIAASSVTQAPRKSGNTKSTQDRSKIGNTSHTQVQVQLLARTRSTQYLGFKTEADMRAFLKAVSK